MMDALSALICSADSFACNCVQSNAMIKSYEPGWHIIIQKPS